MDKKFEVNEFDYENAGQARAIASVLGYSENYNNNVITFTRDQEKHEIPLSILKEGNSTSNRDELVRESQDRVISFFDKGQATDNFSQYSKELLDNHNLAVVRWEDLKKGQKNAGAFSDDGFTVIDLDKKVAYTGADLYKYAYEQNYVLNGQGSSVDLSVDKLKQIGIDTDKLSEKDIRNLKSGNMTELVNFSIPDTPQNRQLLDDEKVKYSVGKDGSLDFAGKVSAIKYVEAENNNENKSKLKKHEIDFKEDGNKIKVEGVNARKLAIAAITLVYPVAGIALMVVPQRNEIKNDSKLSKNEISRLESGELISRNNSKGENILMQLDKDTNSLVSVKAKDLNVPNKINGTLLSPIQQEKLKNGEEIKIESKRGAINVKLDLNSPNGLHIKEAQERVIKMDEKVGGDNAQTKEQIPSQIIDEKQRLEYVGRKGVEGIDMLFNGKGEAEKNDFLAKNSLMKDYREYKNLDNEYSEASRGDNHSTMKNINSQQSVLNENIKSNALSQSEKMGADLEKGYGRAYGAKNEPKTGITL